MFIKTKLGILTWTEICWEGPDKLQVRELFISLYYRSKLLISIKPFCLSREKLLLKLAKINSILLIADSYDLSCFVEHFISFGFRRLPSFNSHRNFDQIKDFVDLGEIGEGVIDEKQHIFPVANTKRLSFAFQQLE